MTAATLELEGDIEIIDDVAAPSQTFDLRGHPPTRLLEIVGRACARAEPGAVLALLVDDPSFPERLQQWLWTANATLLSIEPRDTILEARIRVDPTQANESLGLAKPAPMIHLDSERCALLLLHDDPEALRAALLIANGAAAQGMDTTVFFTFWALNLLREPKMKWTIGKRLLCAITRRQPITCLPELIDHAQQLGVRFTACTMSMSLLGIAARDLHPHPNLDFAGVASFLDDARHASIALVF